MRGQAVRPTAIDPVGCGCTECLTGEYVPLDRATREQVRAMLKGKIQDNTRERWVRKVEVTGTYSGYTVRWEREL